MKLKLNSVNVWIMASVVASTSMVGCTAGGNNPGLEYAPQMYISKAYEAYTQRDEMQYNPYGMTMRVPVNGTVARGQVGFFDYKEGYEAAASWSNPVAATRKNVLTDGKKLYNINCQHCHGATGKNDGGVIKSNQYAPPPWDGYSSDYIKNLPDGQAFHTITFGKGNMGSHAYALTPEERWKVLHYVRFLGAGADEKNFTFAQEETKSTTQTMNVSGQTVGSEELVDMNPKGMGGRIDLGADAQKIQNAIGHVKFGALQYLDFKKESEPHLDVIADFMKSHPEIGRAHV